MGFLFSKRKQLNSIQIKDETQGNLTFKLLMLGDPSVGKSSLLLRYDSNVFQDTFISTIGVDFKEKTMEFEGQPVCFQIWDTAGEERFRTITSSYYRGAHGVLLTFDITNLQTLTHLPKWLSEIDRYAEDSVIVVLVGNKSDITPHIDQDTINDLLYQYPKLSLIRTSAKYGNGVEEAFITIMNRVVADHNSSQWKK
eukprot:TRINITY_DN10713_c0_g1_i3.p1 TRINITY_DN10713_c0_g1~~TRINITY_DN10713_c0_g1_i3.p1  ORF type:complete len:197 (-),score=25.26 TRINITY_DN10713_c0_g1_i3:93-683(-)